MYIAKKWGKSYVVKVYHNGWHPSNQMQSFLTTIRHPNIAHVIESGDYNGNYYEIYEYYSDGTLEDVGALSVVLYGFIYKIYKISLAQRAGDCRSLQKQQGRLHLCGIGLVIFRM